MGKIELSSPVAIVSNILIRLLYNMIQSWSVISGSLQRSCCGCSTLYPFSTKTREVSGNPSLTSERFPETQEREISRVEGNLEGGGDGFPNTFRVLVEYGHSLIINFPADDERMHVILFEICCTASYSLISSKTGRLYLHSLVSKKQFAHTG